MRREISSYALRNYSETVAEAVQDYYKNGYDAAILSIQIIKVLQRELAWQNIGMQSFGIILLQMREV